MTTTTKTLTYQQLASLIERELSKDKTDRRTWAAVEKFWAYEGECRPELFDRVALLESRMERQHGWKR